MILFVLQPHLVEPGPDVREVLVDHVELPRVDLRDHLQCLWLASDQFDSRIEDQCQKALHPPLSTFEDVAELRHGTDGPGKQFCLGVELFPGHELWLVEVAHFSDPLPDGLRSGERRFAASGHMLGFIRSAVSFCAELLIVVGMVFGTIAAMFSLAVIGDWLFSTAHISLRQAAEYAARSFLL